MVLGWHAKADLFELLDYVQAQSPRNANLVAERITKEVQRIARDPETRAPEPDVPGLPAGAIARRATVSGYTIRWIYPFKDPAYLLRWLEERAPNTSIGRE